MVLLIRSTRAGEHIHQRVFVGPDRDHLALAGTLVMSVGEWEHFGAALLQLGREEMKAVRHAQGRPADLVIELQGGPPGGVGMSHVTHVRHIPAVQGEERHAHFRANGWGTMEHQHPVRSEIHGHEGLLSVQLGWAVYRWRFARAVAAQFGLVMVAVAVATLATVLAWWAIVVRA